MAKSPTVDTPKKKRGASVLVWVLLAMLIAGLGSFGATNFGGGESVVGSVGERKITASDYARALRQKINAFSQQMGQPLTLEQAQSFGIDQQVLQSVISRAALDDEATKIGLSVGDKVVASELASMQVFQGIEGKFDVETYKQALESSDLTPMGYENGLRADIARELLQGAVAGGFKVPKAVTDTLYAWAGERRGFSVLRLYETSLPTPLTEPTPAELQTHYDTNIADFTRPEAKRITYVALLPDELAQTMPVDEAALTKLYQDKIAEYVIPEKRLVERLAFGTEAEATAAKARLDAGETFEALVAERGLTLEDLDLGDVAKGELGAAGEAIFALAGPGIAGPFPSDIGPALFRMNAVLAAQETTFDQARPALLVELQTEAARKAIADRVDAIDDLLAGGASFEDLVKDEKMTLGTIDYAAGADDNGPIAGYTAFRKKAESLTEGDFPEAVILEDGGVIAMRLDEIVPPTPKPFADVKETVTQAWRADALSKALTLQASTIKTQVEAGKSIGTFGVIDRIAAMDRQGALEGAPSSVLTTAFQMNLNEVRIVEEQGYVAVLIVQSIEPAATTGQDAEALRGAIEVETQKGFAADAFALYASSLGDRAGVTIDQAVISAVHSQFQN